MAPSLRRSAARLAPTRSSLTRSALTHVTLISHLGAHPGDRSFLVVRERPGTSATGECLALHGAFDQSVSELLSSLALASSTVPLLIDLNGVSALDENCLLRLLKVQRELAPRRLVSFQTAGEGPALCLIRRLRLEARFGLEPVKCLPKQSLANTPRVRQTRSIQWATNENL